MRVNVNLSDGPGSASEEYEIPADKISGPG
jgi:hypothetical protein